MRKLLLIIIVFICNNNVWSQTCQFISPSVEIVNTQQQVNGDCQITLNLAFDIITNSGNKIIYVHLWKSSDYPGYNYNQSGNPPPTNATALSNTVADITINNFGTTPVLLCNYGPDPTVVVQCPSNNPAITIAKTTSATPGATRFIINNLVVTLRNTVCGNNVIFTGDAWSSNSNAANAKVQCYVTGFLVGITSPAVNGTCNNSTSPSTFNFSIDPGPTNSTLQVYYHVYLDNGDSLLNPVNDSLLSSGGLTTPITISPSSFFVSGPQNYPSQIASTTRKVYVLVGIVGQTYLIYTEIIPCQGVLSIKLKNFSAINNNHAIVLNWTTENEQNSRGFEIQRKTDGVFKTIGFVASKANAGRSDLPINYVYKDDDLLIGEHAYYRLKQIDLNGKETYSEICIAKPFISNSPVAVFPNPVANGKAKIIVNSLSKVDILVYTSQGFLLKSFFDIRDKQILIENLKTGVYFLKALDKTHNTSYTQKLIVE